MTIHKKPSVPQESLRTQAAIELGREDFQHGIDQCPRYYCSKPALYNAWHFGQRLARAVRNAETQ